MNSPNAMAKIETRIDESTGITFITATGIIALDISLNYFNSSQFKSRTDKIIYDVRQASHSAVSIGSMARLVRAVKPISRVGARVAFVFAKGEDFRKGRAFKAQLESNDYEGKFQIFSDIEKAMDWLQQSENSAH